MQFEIILAGVDFAGLLAAELSLLYVKRQVRRNRGHFDDRLRSLHKEMTEGDTTTFAMTVKRTAIGLDAIEKEVAKIIKVRKPSRSRKKKRK